MLRNYNLTPYWDYFPKVVWDVDQRLDRVERSLREYFEQAPVGEFAARKAALEILNEGE